MLIIYKVIIVYCYTFSLRLVRHLYRLCNFNNLQMPDKYVNQDCCPINTLENKSDVFLEINSIMNVTSIRTYVGTTMGYLHNSQ